jgi:hypothetical protein
MERGDSISRKIERPTFEAETPTGHVEQDK